MATKILKLGDDASIIFSMLSKIIIGARISVLDGTYGISFLMKVSNSNADVDFGNEWSFHSFNSDWYIYDKAGELVNKFDDKLVRNCSLTKQAASLFTGKIIEKIFFSEKLVYVIADDAKIALNMVEIVDDRVLNEEEKNSFLLAVKYSNKFSLYWMYDGTICFGESDSK